MIENLHMDLERLKQEVARAGRTTIVLAQDALEQHFHGLTLGQIVKLTDAPALATISRPQTADGTHIERFSVDGKDAQLCEAAAQQFTLDPTATLGNGDVREARVCKDDIVRETLVRDHNDVVYRVTDRQAVVDEQLTATLQSLRQRVSPPQATPGLAEQRPMPAPGAGSSDIANEILRGLMALRSFNAVTARTIEDLVGTTGGQTLETALTTVDPRTLLEAFRRIVSASAEIEALLDILTERTTALTRPAGPHDATRQPAAAFAAARPAGGEVEAGESPVPFQTF
jgi:hypothetical protein